MSMSGSSQATVVVERTAALAMTCRFCGTTTDHVFVDLGMSPLCESILPFNQLNQMEPFYPLRVYVCPRCFLVQLAEYVSPEHIFTEYAYFSSYSSSWVEHARVYAEAMRQRLALTGKSLVVELASNDGYLLQHFVASGIPVIGVEPAVNVAEMARSKGVPTRTCFFGTATARTMDAEETYELSTILGIADKVIWTGEYAWDSDEASVYLHTADACVLPFNDGVTLNRSSLGAAAFHGLPIVTTKEVRILSDVLSPTSPAMRKMHMAEHVRENFLN
jgi:putative zinc binding protein